MSAAQIASDVQWAGTGGACKCYVDLNNKLYTAFWQSPSHEYPDDFSSVRMEPVTLSAEAEIAWSKSKLLDFGSSAFVRILDEDSEFPILKIARPDEESREMIKREHDILKRLFQAGFSSMPRFDPTPLEDAEGIFGFRMERLFNLDYLNAYSEDARKAVKELHSIGYSHSDLHSSNIMVDEQGKLVMIDFAFAGVLGEPLPAAPYFRILPLKGGVFNKSLDEEGLDNIFGKQ